MREERLVLGRRDEELEVNTVTNRQVPVDFGPKSYNPFPNMPPLSVLTCAREIGMV